MKIVAAMVLATTLLAAPAAQAASVKVGRLACNVAAGTGFILGSSKDVSCRFHRINHSTESYYGEINKVGIDIGKTEATHIEWLVFAVDASHYNTGALSGNYFGASAEATVGVGLGGNILIGGFQDSFVLQPFSIQAQTGLNFAVGLANLTLH